MPWQDIVFSVGSLIFVFALIPTLRSKEKPAFTTSFITALVLSIFALTYITLSLWGSAFFQGCTAACWFLLAFQKHMQGKRKKG